MNKKCILFVLLSVGTLMARAQERTSIIKYLAVRSSSLDRDSCIYDAYERFLDEESSHSVRLFDDYLHVDKYDSLIVLDDGTQVGAAIKKKVKDATSAAKSILGYNVSSPDERHAMSLIQPAAEIYFEETGLADTLCRKIQEPGEAGDAAGDAFVVVSLLKVYSNAELLADINRTAKLASFVTGGLSFVTSSIVKKALMATAGKGYSVISTNLFYKLDTDGKRLTNVGKTNNYGIIKTAGSSSTAEIIEDATLKALSNTEEELLGEYAKDKAESRQLLKTIKSKLGIEGNK